MIFDHENNINDNIKIKGIDLTKKSKSEIKKLISNEISFRELNKDVLEISFKNHFYNVKIDKDEIIDMFYNNININLLKSKKYKRIKDELITMHLK